MRQGASVEDAVRLALDEVERLEIRTPRGSTSSRWTLAADTPPRPPPRRHVRLDGDDAPSPVEAPRLLVGGRAGDSPP
ncbi:MAG: hypothetical protein WKH64_04035 [Chloroflexia bacterium]